MADEHSASGGGSLADFGASFKGFMDQMAAQAPAAEPVFLTLVRKHFGAEPATFPVIAQDFEAAEHANLQKAIDGYLAERGGASELIGITADQPYALAGIGLAQLIMPARGGLWGGSGVTQGPVQYVNIGLDEGNVLACVQCGLFLVTEPGRKLAALVRGPSDMGMSRQVHIEVMAPRREDAERFLSELRTLMRKRNVYRGHVISLSTDRYEGVQVHFHRLPKIERDRIILPEGLLQRIERQTLGFAKHSERLRAMGRHLKRGLLLHGAPGTGKTLTAMYLSAQMTGRTVLLLTGRGLGLVERSCAMARVLQPAIVILEDVDLVAEERTRPTAACTALLFELLNQMDGLADDADILFLLTTNRPDILEPALASRPGRIDQAIEVPLPDEACRRRLLALYGQGLELRLRREDEIIARTKGASAAFIKELMRKAALFAADERADAVVEDRHIEEALHELVVDGGELTKSLLGVR
ncbi:MAG TPA: AAA family ATPase [Burkholderiales bacterium]|nr:AAA family ATPase [Burkholderiales bacterium]